MSKLTSMLRSGKRAIIKTRTGFRSATRTALGQPDRAVSQDPMRPQDDVLAASHMTTLGQPDRGVSHDPMRPQDDSLRAGHMTALGRPDRRVAQDPLAPPDDFGMGA